MPGENSFTVNPSEAARNLVIRRVSGDLKFHSRLNPVAPRYNQRSKRSTNRLASQLSIMPRRMLAVSIGQR